MARMSLPQIDEAFIRSSTCPCPGVGTSTSTCSTVLSPGRRTPVITVMCSPPSSRVSSGQEVRRERTSERCARTSECVEGGHPGQPARIMCAKGAQLSGGVERMAAAGGPAHLVLTAAVARRYYVEDASKVEIAEEYGLSRFQVARLLDRARASGLVTITISAPGALDVDLSDRL